MHMLFNILLMESNIQNVQIYNIIKILYIIILQIFNYFMS